MSACWDIPFTQAWHFGRSALFEYASRQERLFFVCVAEFNRCQGLVFPKYYLTVRACSAAVTEGFCLHSNQRRRKARCEVQASLFSLLTVSTHLANRIVFLHFYLVCKCTIKSYGCMMWWKDATTVGNFINNNTPPKKRIFLGVWPTIQRLLFLPFPPAPHT